MNAQNLKIQIRNGGIYTRHPKGFSIHRPKGFDCHVLLLMRTQANLWIDGRDYLVSPNTALWLTPGTPYSYSNPEGEYANDWLHLLPNTNVPAIANRPIPLSNPSILSSYMNLLLWESHYGYPATQEENLTSLLRLVTNLLQEEASHLTEARYSPYRYRLQELALRVHSCPEDQTDAAGCARELGLSLSYFEHLYRDLFGISYRRDLILSRVDRAKELLLSENLPVAEIACHLGYHSEVHFYRQFKAVTGMTPAAYRRLSSPS